MKMNKYLLIIIGSVLLVILVFTFVFITMSTRSSDKPVPIELINQEGENEQKGEIYQADLIKQNPLLENLPHYSDSFEVHYGIENKETYSVSYKVVLIPQSTPDSAEIYQGELNLLRNRALDWIRSKGVDPETLEIEWTTR